MHGTHCQLCIPTGRSAKKKAPNLQVRGLTMHRFTSTSINDYSIGIATPGAMIPVGSTAFLMIFAIEK